MAETGRLVVMRGSEIAIRAYPVVGPAPGAILVRQELSDICGTDVHNRKHQRMQEWTPLGHENVGVVEGLGYVRQSGTWERDREGGAAGPGGVDQAPLPSPVDRCGGRGEDRGAAF